MSISSIKISYKARKFEIKIFDDDRIASILNNFGTINTISLLPFFCALFAAIQIVGLHVKSSLILSTNQNRVLFCVANQRQGRRQFDSLWSDYIWCLTCHSWPRNQSRHRLNQKSKHAIRKIGHMAVVASETSAVQQF